LLLITEGQDALPIGRIGQFRHDSARTGAREGALRTAVPLLLILRMGGGTGTTLTSGLMGHNQSKKRPKTTPVLV
jgi:hypothetical protein